MFSIMYKLIMLFEYYSFNSIQVLNMGCIDVPTSPYHMQIPLETYRCTGECKGHTDVWGHSDIQRGSKYMGASECMGVSKHMGATYGGVQIYGKHLNVWGIQIPPKSDNSHACLYSVH